MLIDTLPPAKVMLADSGYDARWFGKALADRGITPASHRKSTASDRAGAPQFAAAITRRGADGAAMLPAVETNAAAHARAGSGHLCTVRPPPRFAAC